MSAHAIYAPSAMARILACPPSAVLSQGLPERPSGAASVEGTRVHSVIQTALTTGADPAPQPVAPWLKQDNMPDHMVVQHVRDYVRQLGPGSVLVEHKVFLSNNVWGTLDLGHLHDIITVFDYKNGGYDVEAKDNKQLLTYAATFLDSHPNVQWFRLVIFQPNSWAAGSNPNNENGFKQHLHTRAEVEAHREAVRAATLYTGPPKPGPHCRWCDAIPACPAMSQDAYFMMASISRDPTTLSPQELLRMLRIIRSVGDMKDTLEGYLTNALKAGAKVDGAELGSKRKWTAWNDERHAATHLWQAYGPKGVKPISPSAAKKLGTAGAQYAAMASHKPPAEDTVKY
jgi:hypothetical protein